MPIYEFACQDCGHEFEQIQSFSDSSTPACPNCQGTHVQRRLSPPAIHFKGSGWYITDSKNAGKSSATASKSADASKSSDSGKSDSGKNDGAKSESSGGSDGGAASPAPAPASDTKSS
jgi:putative FmdB family regulatory protein